MPSLTLTVAHGSERAKNILTEVQQRVKISERGTQSKYDRWVKAEEQTLAYMPEREVDAMRRASREGGMPQYTTIQIPYTYAVLMSAHTYFTSVFFSRSPVFQYTGRHGESMQAVQAIEALIDYQVQVGYLLPPLYTWLYDAGKYGLGVVGVYWDEQWDHVTSITEEPALLDEFGQEIQRAAKVQITERARTYAGNRLFNIQPWDFLFDARFPVRDFQRGEFCGMRRTLAWAEVKRREAMGYYINIDMIKSKGSGSDWGLSGSAALDRPSATDPTTWIAESNFNINQKHPAEVQIIEMCVEIIPDEWQLGPSTYPEKWVFTCTADYSVLIGVQPLGARHAKFPFQVLALEAEAYGIVPRGLPETLEPIQNTIDWLVNSHFYNVRAALNNRVVVDPSRVVMKDVLDPNPGGVIRLKPEAYGTDVKLALQQFAIQDVTQNHLRDLQMMYGMGERTVGVNDQIMGMMNTGGRKTATEVRTSTSFGVNRLKTTAEYFSAIGFSPLSQMLVQNSQQYYDEEQKYKIVGDLATTAGMGFMMVTPDSIQGFYDFVPVDGTLPVDRFAQANLWRELMVQMRAVPELALQYDFSRIFEWVAQLAGLKNITQFKAQIVPDQNLLMQAKLGNVIPMRPPGGGRKGPGGGAPGSPAPAQAPGPRQTPGMGAMA